MSHHHAVSKTVAGRTDERILDAAYALVARHGIRKTTFEDIAAKAGLSRQTLYRYFANKDTLLNALVEREAERFFEALERVVPEDRDLRTALEDALVFTFDYLATHPLLSWVHENEPHQLIAHLAADWEPLLHATRRFIEPFVAREVAAGRMTPERAEMAGDWITRVTLTYLVTPSAQLDVHDLAAVRRLLPELLLFGLYGEPGSR
jgi:AcrR family transcriptional regulator